MKTIPKNQAGNVPVKWYEPRQCWRLSYFSKGKRCRKFYKERADAVTEWRSVCARAVAFGKAANSYSPAEHAEFNEAKRIVNGRDLREVANIFMAHFQDLGEGKTVGEAYGEYNESKAKRGVSKRHVDSIGYHVGKFADDFFDTPLREFTGEKILKWIMGRRKKKSEKALHPVTIGNYRNLLSGFFNWCARRKFIPFAPTDDISVEDLPVKPSAPKGVLSVAQCEAVMRWVEKNEPRFVPWFALQLFAGIRNAEVERLTWDCCDFARNVLVLEGWRQGTDGEEAQRIVKTGDDWALHDLPANLWAWLKQYKGQGTKGKEWATEEEKRGSAIVAPCNKVLARMRSAFVSVSPAVSPWPKNALRHTFCTMLLSLHGNANLVATWSRHANAQQLFDSYVARLVSKEEAKRFCEIMPTGKTPA